MLPSPDSAAITTVADPATAVSAVDDSLTYRLLYGGAGAVWAFVTSLIGLPPRPTSEVRDPLGDVNSFCAEYEATYGAIHPPFHRSSYAQVRENIGKQKLLPFGHFPKEGGVQPKSKSFFFFLLYLYLKQGFKGFKPPS